MVDKNNKDISVRRQSELLGINRSMLYRESEKVEDTGLINTIVEIYSKYPIYGYRRITSELSKYGYMVNRKAVQRIMKELNLQAIYPKPKTSVKSSEGQVYPYLLKNMTMDKPNIAWQVDITYFRVEQGFMYLTAIIDVCSRMIVGYKLSNSLCADSCLMALENALYNYGVPKVINSDQGSQFTGKDWIDAVESNFIEISMTGKGRCCDNIYIERLWRSMKYEGSYLYKWNTVLELKENIPQWVKWYNEERPHQSLKYRTPLERYNEGEKFIKSRKVKPAANWQNECLFAGITFPVIEL